MKQQLITITLFACPLQDTLRQPAPWWCGRGTTSACTARRRVALLPGWSGGGRTAMPSPPAAGKVRPAHKYAAYSLLLYLFVMFKASYGRQSVDHPYSVHECWLCTNQLVGRTIVKTFFFMASSVLNISFPALPFAWRYLRIQANNDWIIASFTKNIPRNNSLLLLLNIN